MQIRKYMYFGDSLAYQIELYIFNALFFHSYSCTPSPCVSEWVSACVYLMKVSFIYSILAIPNLFAWVALLLSIKWNDPAYIPYTLSILNILWIVHRKYCLDNWQCDVCVFSFLSLYTFLWHLFALQTRLIYLYILLLPSLFPSCISVNSSRNWANIVC